MEGGDLQLLAFKLAMLGFYLGVLIYAAPIPASSIKRWASTLVEDSLIAALLALTAAALIAVAGYLQLLIGGSWPQLDAWLFDAVVFAASLKALSSLVTSLPDPLEALKPLASAAASVMDELSWAVTLLAATVLGLKYLLGYSQILLSLGVLLYAVPFRVAKPAGAWLIAFVIVFNAALPALPLFVESIGDPPAVAGAEGVWVGRITVTSSSGVVEAGLLRIHSGGEEVASYVVKGGVAYSSLVKIPRVQAPLGLVSFTLEYMGVTFKPDPPALDTSTAGTSIELHVPHIAFMGGESVMVYGSKQPARVTEGEEGVVASWEGLKDGDYVEIAWLEGCKPQYSVREGDVRGEGSWTWEGLKGEYVYVEPSGEGRIVVWVEKWGDCDADAGLERIAKDYSETLVSLLDYITLDVLKMIIVYYITLPGMYLSILLVATTGLARLLGGGARLRLKIM
ncbi:hypothetical protein APE_0220 [Aeropyrum pernix K1]|uniref:Uncharacterized protein n=1 Tax=Aeropyrum pernix (strain ATCC 700893 / DSM 11879 / JCM 9820 / NBRC 100138 / K1) TaxID=272557 RepID=Q9YFM9_AERPE|nr:hypothetical protein [Aeropyrum pernix]BAA79132.1 hypothetical protein APE_0220 [Aeropyrum pernix K1]